MVVECELYWLLMDGAVICDILDYLAWLNMAQIVDRVV